jgi:8-oxo-dGTP diphosphatase
MKKRPLTPEHLRFAVIAVDIALFTIRDNELLVRLIRVNRPPLFSNSQGLPGGLIDPKETAEETAKRLIRTKGMLDAEKLYTEQLYTFSALERDPRGRVVAVAYLALVPWERLSATEQADTHDAWWAPVNEIRSLAYDHDQMLTIAIDRLRSRITYTTLIGKLMPKEFTLTELEHSYESILHTGLDKRNFRKKILKLNFITPLPHKRTGGAFRPAQLYRLSSSKVREVEVL